MISNWLMVMTVASQAERMGLIEQCVWCVRACVCVCVCVLGRGCGGDLQMAAVSMVAIKCWEVSGQG